MHDFKGISMFDLSMRESVYTFVDGNTGEPTHIAAGVLLKALEAVNWPVSEAEIGETLVRALERGDLGIEEPHALSLPEAALDAPVIVCEWGDTHVIADGAHRIWRRWKRGDTNLFAYLVPEDAWRAFVIYDAPGSGEYWDNFNRTAKVRS